jgi:hypothetical protein
MRKIAILLTMALLAASLMSVAQPARAERMIYYVWTDSYYYVLGDRVMIHYETYADLPYGSRVVLLNRDTGMGIVSDRPPVVAGHYRFSCYTCGRYEGHWLVSFRAMDQSYVARAYFEVSTTLYYENENVTQTYTNTEQTPLDETIMLFTTGQQSTITAATAVTTPPVETQRLDMAGLMSAAIVAGIAGLAVGLVIGRRKKS